MPRIRMRCACRWCRKARRTGQQQTNQIALVGCFGLLLDSLEIGTGGVVTDAQSLRRPDHRFALHQQLREARFPFSGRLPDGR